MASAPSSLPNSLGLELETTSPSSVETQLFDIFVAYLPGQSQVSASAAAGQIHQLLLGTKISSGDNQGALWLEVGGFLHAFWDMYFLLGTQINAGSSSMDRHVALVVALKQMPSDVTLESSWSSGPPSRVWQDLPQMSMFLTERWTQMPPRSHEPLDEVCRKWYNMNALLARLNTTELCNTQLCALQSIALGLEGYDKRDTKFLFSCTLPAAALWLREHSTAASLLEACRRGECRHSRSGGYYWKMDEKNEDDPRRGFSLERWDFWRQRLEILSRHREADERSKEICRVALDVMEKAASQRG